MKLIVVIDNTKTWNTHVGLKKKMDVDLKIEQEL
jgi:hypothetical protein